MPPGLLIISLSIITDPCHISCHLTNLFLSVSFTLNTLHLTQTLTAGELSAISDLDELVIGTRAVRSAWKTVFWTVLRGAGETYASLRSCYFTWTQRQIINDVTHWGLNQCMLGSKWTLEELNGSWYMWIVTYTCIKGQIRQVKSSLQTLILLTCLFYQEPCKNKCHHC